MTTLRRSAAAHRPLLPALLALVVAALAIGFAPQAAAQDDAITWAVSPSTGGVPDKRSWVELELEPGAVASDEAVVRNLSTEAVTFRISAADGYFTDTGRFSMLESGRESVDAGTWISAPETVTVEPGGSGTVPFTVTVPENATPGDHAAGIAASVVSQGTGPDGSGVGVESRIGFRVMTRVTTGSRGTRSSPAPSRSSPTSSTRAMCACCSTAPRVPRAPPPPLVASDAARQELLPGDRRAVSVQLDGIWPLFGVGADLTVAPTVVAPDQDPAAVAPVTESLTVAAVPLPQLLVLAGVALVLAALLAGRSRSRPAPVREPRTVEGARYPGLPRRSGVPSALGRAPE